MFKQPDLSLILLTHGSVSDVIGIYKKAIKTITIASLNTSIFLIIKYMDDFCTHDIFILRHYLFQKVILSDERKQSV